MRSRRSRKSGWSRNQALVVLAVVTTALAIMSEVLTGSIEPASESLHLSPRFTGVFLLALVGNAAELMSAVRFARKDQMDLCIGITVGASVQVGLVVAPVLVFMGMLMGQDMNLIFSPLELIAIVMAIYLTRNLIYDGESSWLEGLIMIGVYFLFGIGFLHQPGTDPPNPCSRPRPPGPDPEGHLMRRFVADPRHACCTTRPAPGAAAGTRRPLGRSSVPTAHRLSMSRSTPGTSRAACSTPEVRVPCRPGPARALVPEVDPGNARPVGAAGEHRGAAAGGPAGDGRSAGTGMTSSSSAWLPTFRKGPAA